MRKHSSKYAWLLCAYPSLAHAQHVPVWLVVAVLSPLAVLFLTIVLGVVSKNWRIGAMHAGIVVGWVLLFALVSNIFTNDYVIWTPLVAYAVHTLVILVLIMVNIVKLIRGRNTHEST